MPDKTQYEIAKEIAAMGEKVCEVCEDPRCMHSGDKAHYAGRLSESPSPCKFCKDGDKWKPPYSHEGAFEVRMEALQAFLQNKGGQDSDDPYDIVWRPEAHTVWEYIGDHFAPRDFWPDKIDAALEAAHQAGERGDPLEGLDLGLG